MADTLKSVVIVGAGLAGLHAAESLRRRGFTGAVTILGEEAHPPYNRPPLSKQVLRGDQYDPVLRSDADLGALKIMLSLSRTVRAVDVGARSISTDDGSLPYDALVIATGAVPRRIPGVGGYVLRSLDDAYVLRDRFKVAHSVGIIGAGVLGCEIASAAREIGLRVDLVDALPAPMVRVLGTTVSENISNLHRSHGVTLRMNSHVRVSEGVTIVNGNPLDVDIVVEALGARPNTDWLVDSGLTLSDGVQCDSTGRAADGVFAVGDVARWDGVRSEHWTAATLQADIVGAAVLGQPLPPPELPYWWSHQYDQKIQGLGQIAGADEITTLRSGAKQRPVALFSRNSFVIGAVGFSAGAAMTRLRTHIAHRSSVASILEGEQG